MEIEGSGWPGQRVGLREGGAETRARLARLAWLGRSPIRSFEHSADSISPPQAQWRRAQRCQQEGSHRVMAHDGAVGTSDNDD